MKKTIRSLEYKDGKLHLIDQRQLPAVYEEFICKNYKDVDFAISDMVVRGAPAIGVTAAYGIVLAAQEYVELSPSEFFDRMHKACDVINQSRPTAVNLMWAVKQMRQLLNEDLSPKEILTNMLSRAEEIADEDVKTNKTMGSHGNSLVPQNATILTHCNTGALATVEYGTALGVVRAAHDSGKNIFVYADETRPRLQGGRLTAWELVQEGIPAKLIADNVAATLIRDGKIDLILVGADRIANNGDSANKIGTFMLSVVAKAYNVPFYIVAPTTTIDFEMASGDEIEIEERSSTEVTHIKGVQVAPTEIDVYNPAFDVTPADNISAIVTEKGVIVKPFHENIMKLNNS